MWPDVLIIERGDDIAKDYMAANKMRTYVTDMIGIERRLSVSLAAAQILRCRALSNAQVGLRETVQEKGISPAWPVSYDEIDPYYEEAEILYKVHDQARTIRVSLHVGCPSRSRRFRTLFP